jgi:hypothetical protein
MTALDGQLTIPCSAETGVEFTNTQGADVTFKFTPSSDSFSLATDFVLESTPAGIKDFKYQSAMKYPKNTSFALLAVSKQTGAVLAEVGKETTLVLKPGETLIFLLNDVPGCYNDNTGSVTVKWSAKSPQPQSGTLQVPANSLPGVPWANTFGNSVRVQFTASGQWAYNPAVGMHGAGGHPRYSNAGRGYRMPGRPEGALIARRGNGSYEFVGQQAILTVAAGETISLTINDDEGGVQGAGFRDNQGAVTVQWTVVP